MSGVPREQTGPKAPGYPRAVPTGTPKDVETPQRGSLFPAVRPITPSRWEMPVACWLLQRWPLH